MDQTTPDQATPERTLETEAAAPPRAPQHRPASARTRRVEAALRAKAGTDHIVEWARAWVSRGTPMHRLLAARTLDFAVLTDDTMTLVSTGFFTRRPRRRVYCTELRGLSVAEDPVRRGRRLRLCSDTGPELWLELGADVRGKALADALMARTGREQT
jgi:hypothetical protein